MLIEVKSDYRGSQENEFSRIKKLSRRVMKAGLWRRVRMVDGAALRTVQWVLEKGDEDLVVRMKRSTVVGEMVRSASEKLVNLLQRAGYFLNFRAKALMEGTSIVKERIATYRENGVFRWAPWVEKWLQETDTILFLGSISAGRPYRKRW